MNGKINTCRILSPTGILGYGFPEVSFRRGLERDPHLIAVDAGSTDPGPHYLGSGKSFTSRAGVKRDLGLLVQAALDRDIPLLVGTAGGAGARPHLDWCREILLELARERDWSFRLGTIPTDVAHDDVLRAMDEDRIRPLTNVPPLTRAAVAETTCVVAQAGIEPIQEALRQGCQIILCGRCYDPAVFAAWPIEHGYDPGLALHLGKILECAAIAATPGSGADCVLGTLEQDRFLLETLNPERRFTPESTAAHTLYEKSDPYHLPGPGGVLNLEDCTFTEEPDGRVAVAGSRFEPAAQPWIKLEGARPTGYRTVSIAGVRDPIMIRGIDDILAAVREQVLQDAGDGARVLFHVYGRNGVMEDLEPVREPASHELGLVIEALAPTQAQADSLCSLTRSTLLHYGYPGRVATAGNLAILFSPSEFSAGPVYEFSLYHLMRMPEGMRFPVEIAEVS